VDTLKELFEGNRELFEGLAAEPRWDWSRAMPGHPHQLFGRRGAPGGSSWSSASMRNLRINGRAWAWRCAGFAGGGPGRPTSPN
jgi:hypothetical protein